MTKLTEDSQWNTGRHIFKCWCGEDSYLEVIQDVEDGEYYISITQHPTRLKERLAMAWKALRGIEFTASNSVMIVEKDAKKLVKALTPTKKGANNE